MGKEEKNKKRRHTRAALSKRTSPFLPVTRAELFERRWDEVDVVLVTGDAYIDHPSLGVALIGRLLEREGFRVAILAQPRHHTPEDFRRFGRPRLFFGITAGNLDSICSNYTGNARVRKKDAYSPGGDPYFGGVTDRRHRRRPDRATIRYAQLAKEAYGDVCIVLGGLEASLRRFCHYDYQQEAIRSSVLADAKADVLVYGMGELAIIEIAHRLALKKDLKGIRGTCIRLGNREALDIMDKRAPIQLPSFEEIKKDPRLFLEAERIIDRASRLQLDQPLIQRQKGEVWVLQEPPQRSLTQNELDSLYEMPFTRLVHPQFGQVPAHDMVKTSVTIIRGCPGNCSFCAINRHQGPLWTERSIDSVIKEIERLRDAPWFHGVISDVGGPTANLFGTRCAVAGACKKRDCLYPVVCKNLRIDEEVFLELLEAVKKVRGVSRVFVSSGLRMDLLLKTPKLLATVIEHHMPGRIKIAPEHTESPVLELMHKPGKEVLEDFLTMSRTLLKKRGRRPRFSAYFISAHPGCTVDHMRAACKHLKHCGLSRIEVQDFTPTPGTLSTAMYVSGLHRDREIPIHVPKGRSERREQRRIIEQCLRERKKR